MATCGENLDQIRGIIRLRAGGLDCNGWQGDYGGMCTGVLTIDICQLIQPHLFQ
ncbi:hypothetical protein RBSH_06109 [Rhodopirellula baltica SH28]|uniref:Uncharacterized protein n=4 Tax=Rhodopirellula baltica TaxID=265606 RepID=Q7UQZ4_RHOBA|nr:hypothetical protein RBWH47_01510 [Rhodopirellula baltica WH47]EKJ98650.1 hypothetical protein RBSH_06109 [Rhodopirellula baltica SH28]ELP35996.1 hypothetical protein RBSWK_00060 [Rhodopirellula baltica SWK14]CAD74548.1 hypothetical protein RB5989 [Rhodopirellula baltica SH 1]